MFDDFTITDWTYHLKTWYSFDCTLWKFDPGDPYYKAMQIFQAFTDRIVAALHLNDNTSLALMQDCKLQIIYDGFPCFHVEGDATTFRTWIKEATLKHPQRRTAKQFQWLFIVDAQTMMPTGDIAFMVQQAVDCISKWEDSAWALNNLRIDPDDSEYFFRNEHTVKNVVDREPSEFGESCCICTDDFDADIHHPQQGPCGHVYCRACFQKTLPHAVEPSQKLQPAKYRCAFCRSCLVCGVNDCGFHVIASELRRPHPLHLALREHHLLCDPKRGICAANDLEPLFGISPWYYWSLREQSRQIRVNMGILLKTLTHNLDHNHKHRTMEELVQIEMKLRIMALKARLSSQEGGEPGRRPEAL